MATLKYSRQREAIKRCLASRRDHPTAEMIYTQLRDKDPRLSLGTVYRNLALLSQLGEIRKIPTEDGPDRFDGDTSRHFHFICRRCHAVTDLMVPEADTLIAKTASLTDGEVEEIVMNAYGLCRSCADVSSMKDAAVRN